MTQGRTTSAARDARLARGDATGEAAGRRQHGVSRSGSIYGGAAHDEQETAAPSRTRLDALLGSYEPGTADKDELRQIPLDSLRRGKYQPRTHMDAQALKNLRPRSGPKAWCSRSWCARARQRRLRTSPVSAAGARRNSPASKPSPQWCARFPDEAAIMIAYREHSARRFKSDRRSQRVAASGRRIWHDPPAGGRGRGVRAAVTNPLRL